MRKRVWLIYMLLFLVFFFVGIIRARRIMQVGVVIGVWSIDRRLLISNRNEKNQVSS